MHHQFIALQYIILLHFHRTEEDLKINFHFYLAHMCDFRMYDCKFVTLFMILEVNSGVGIEFCYKWN